MGVRERRLAVRAKKLAPLKIEEYNPLFTISLSVTYVFILCLFSSK